MMPIPNESSRVLFSFHEADSIHAIGEFNNWSTVATPLTETPEHEWELQLPHGVDVAHLGFFVIGKGAHSGRAINYADLVYTR